MLSANVCIRRIWESVLLSFIPVALVRDVRVDGIRDVLVALNWDFPVVLVRVTPGICILDHSTLVIIIVTQ